MELKIPYKFQWLANFTEGLAAFEEAGRIGYCNEEGEVIIRAKYQKAKIFNEGLAPVAEGNLYGFIDKDDALVVYPSFDNAQPFFEGKACVYSKGKCGFIQSDGSWVHPPDLDSAGNFSEGYAPVKYKDQFFYLDGNGNRVGPGFDLCESFHLGRSLCRIDDRYVIVDTSFSNTSPLPRFQWAGLSPTDDIIAFSRNGFYGYARWTEQKCLNRNTMRPISFLNLVLE